jgi:hypothetical protein
MNAIGGHQLQLRLVSMEFPAVEQMKEGLGEIRIEFAADVPRGSANRRLIFENHHQSGIAAYLVNCLVPRDPDIRVSAQNRNYPGGQACPHCSVRQRFFCSHDSHSTAASNLPLFIRRPPANAR